MGISIGTLLVEMCVFALGNTEMRINLSLHVD